MKKIFISFIIFCLFNLFLLSQDPISILKKIDNNEFYRSIKYEGEMIIYISGKKYEKTFYALAKGTKNSFIEFTNQDDLGTKYLKKDGNLYVYSPDAEKVIPITGHMLKESMMGSDMSYEDTIDNEPLEARYNPAIIGEEKINDRDCWILELIARKKTESYPKQKIWVTKDTYNALKVELYSLSGAKLKEQNLLNYQKIKDRYFPTEIEMKDLLRKNSKTVFKMNKIELDIDIPDSTFNLKNLEK